MKQRKINDKVLLEMIEQGKTQRQCAKFFGVSDMAISKRLKRLPLMPESLKKLSPEKQKFAVLKAEGLSNGDALLKAFPDVASRVAARVRGHELMQDPDVQTAITDLMAQEGIGRRTRIQRLKEHIFSKSPEVSLRALDQSFRLDGYPKEAGTNINILNLTISDEEKETLQNLADGFVRQKIQEARDKVIEGEGIAEVHEE